MARANSLGLFARDGGWPSSHVISKVVGDPLTLTWGSVNLAAQPRVVRLAIYETRSAGLFLTGGTPWLNLPAGTQLTLDASGPTNTLWTQSQALRAVLRQEGAVSVAEVAAGHSIVVVEHIFSLTVAPGPLPM